MCELVDSTGCLSVWSAAANIFRGCPISPSSNSQVIDRERVSLAVIDDTYSDVGMEEQLIVSSQLLPRPTATRKRKKRRNASEKLIEQSGVQVEDVSILFERFYFLLYF